MKIALVSLGCAKNRVSSEQMMGKLREAGHTLTPDPGLAEAVIVNTCGFIESAKQEAIAEILELSQLKAEGGLKILLAAGCLVERYKDEVLTELPELDGLLGCGSFLAVAEALEAAVRGEKPKFFGDIDAPETDVPRVLSTPPYTAYLRIAEGCDNRCAYCVIPSLRGRFRSRPMDGLLAEAARLVAGGVRELVIVAQDTARYGLDLYGERRLPALLTALCGLEELRWLRLHYLYPSEVDEALLDVFVNEKKLVRYIDMPIQHIGDALLTSMGRRGGRKAVENAVTLVRRMLPEAVIRTSLIAGLPGESDQAFEELCRFLAENKLERVGVFSYSPEEGTAAADMEGQIPEDVKQQRVERLEEIQADVLDGYNRNMRNTTREVVCEGYDRFAGLYFGRSFSEAPEVDGKVFFTSREVIQPGAFVQVKITGVIGGDLRGSALSKKAGGKRA